MEKKKIWWIVGLLVLFWMSASGQYINNNPNVDGMILLHGLIDVLITCFIMTIVPLCVVLIKKGRLEVSFGKKICMWNSIIIFIISIVLSVIVLDGDGTMGIGGLGALMFYFINEWIFVDENKTTNTSNNKKKNETNKNLLKYIPYVVIIILVLFILLLLVFYKKDTDNDITNNEHYYEQESELKEEFVYVVTNDVSSITITADSSGGVGDVFSTTNSNLKYRIHDNKIGDTFQVYEKYNGDESRYEYNEDWYVIILDNGEKGYIWGGYQGMYVNEN